MTIIELIRLIIGTLCLVAGIAVFILEVFGIYKMKYVLNRLHSAAMGDTMGLFLCVLGLCFYSGLNFTTAKFILLVVLFWIASPVASHLTALLESYTNDRLSRHLKFEGQLKSLEKKLEKEKEQGK